jgi:hypothetical protein
VSTPGPYTRGEQVLKPCDVEYLFRAINDDLAATENRLRSLADHFQGVNDDLANQLQIAVSNTISARSYANVSKRAALRTIMPHRDHAGEHEHW